MKILFLPEPNGHGLYVRLIPAGLGENVQLDFYRAGTSRIEATLLGRHLQEGLDAQMELVRRVSYLRGWRDAKSKRKKHEWFASCVDVREWESKEAGL